MEIEKCNICPRKCNALRRENDGDGVCKTGTLPKLARASAHFWEEPCISGTKGSGTVFFSGCNLKCVFCQNYEISTGGFGKTVSVERLKEIYSELIASGVHNINLVTPTHFAPQVLKSLDEPLPVPVVYNSSGYESIETLKKFDGKVNIYMPDFKYADSEIAKKYSSAENYPEIAKKAISEMYRQVGKCEFDKDGMLIKGVLIRHLMLPNNLENTLDVIDWVSENFKSDEILFSLMRQYTPPKGGCKYKELENRVTDEEYKRAENYMYLCGIENGFVQESDSAQSEYTPYFNAEGI